MSIKRESRWKCRKRWLREEQREIAYPRCFGWQLGVCAALFLVLFGVKNMKAEPVQTALAGLRSVATTEMELGRSIGKLEFVDRFVPESVLVFWNAEQKGLALPLRDGALLLDEGGLVPLYYDNSQIYVQSYVSGLSMPMFGSDFEFSRVKILAH